jgi:23S rRNA pseudouridine1911/1915/1917 synthase
MPEFLAAKADRLDRVLRESGVAGSEWLSRQAWDWLIENGRVEVNTRKCVKAGASLKAGDSVRIDLPFPLGLHASGEAPVPVWEAPDRSFAIFNKPAQIASLPLLPWDQTSFASHVASFAESSGWLPPGAFARLAPPPNLEGGLLQRLDNDTSGLLAAAFTEQRKGALRPLFSGAKFEKAYLALVTALPPAGEKNLWLSGAGAKVKASLVEPKGESDPSAITVKIVKKNANGALVEVRTRFGGRHIVRAGMAALGAPLLGDALYGGSEAAPFHQLHASRLKLLEQGAFPGFPEVSCDPPQSFLDSAAELGLN